MARKEVVRSALSGVVEFMSKLFLSQIDCTSMLQFALASARNFHVTKDREMKNRWLDGFGARFRNDQPNQLTWSAVARKGRQSKSFNEL